MADSGNAFRNQHDISEIEDIEKKDAETPEDADDDFLEGAEKDTDIDKLHVEAVGVRDNLPIKDIVSREEVRRVKGIRGKEQEKKKKKVIL